MKYLFPLLIAFGLSGCIGSTSYKPAEQNLDRLQNEKIKIRTLSEVITYFGLPSNTKKVDFQGQRLKYLYYKFEADTTSYLLAIPTYYDQTSGYYEALVSNIKSNSKKEYDLIIVLNNNDEVIHYEAI